MRDLWLVQELLKASQRSVKACGMVRVRLAFVAVFLIVVGGRKDGQGQVIVVPLVTTCLTLM